MSKGGAGFSLPLATGLLAVLMVSALAPLIGTEPLDYAKVWAGVWPDREIFLDFRLPRVALALLTGAALAGAGVLFQALLRDALATPYTLGVSSGASLGAVCAICFNLPPLLGLPAAEITALGGALGALALVLAIAGGGRRMSSFTLLLAGVTMNSMAMALILLLHSMANFAQSFAIAHWLMGGLEAPGWTHLGLLAGVIAALAAVAMWGARSWNLLAVGEEWAASRGVSPRRLLLTGYLTASLLTAAVTALTGPIGFVGLIVPHALRLRFGSDHRLLLPCSFLYGAAFLVACDILSRTLLRATEIPVGVITALLGGPLFIALLRSGRKSLWL